MSQAASDAIDSISPADAWGGDDALLRVTRTAAARHAPTKAAPRGWRGVLSAEHESECDRTPSLLAQQANGELPPARQSSLEEHLQRCLFCRAAELREHRAARAFSAVIATGDPRAWRSAAPRTADAPRPPTPAAAGPAAAGPAAAARAAAGPPTAAPADPSPPTEVAATAQPPQVSAPPRRGLVVFPATSTHAVIAAPPRRRDRHAGSGPRSRVAPGLLTAYLPFLVTLAVGAALVVVIAFLVGGGAKAQNAAALLPPPSAASTPPPSVGLTATQKTPAPRTHATATHPSTTPTASATTTTPAARTTAAATQANPVASNTPAANPTPAPSPPAKPRPTTTSSPSPVVASQQGTGLPAATAPTETIGGGTPTTH
jgi:hypothetical protein